MTPPASGDVEYRIEHDTMGEVRVPATALWRAQTQRAVENFPISFRGLDRNQIRAMALLKAACAQVNKDLGLLAAEKADAIIAAVQREISSRSMPLSRMAIASAAICSSATAPRV